MRSPKWWLLAIHVIIVEWNSEINKVVDRGINELIFTN